MSDQSAELLGGFRVYSNWKERATVYERLGQQAFAVSLVAVVLLVCLIGAYRLFGEWQPVRLIFASEAVWIVLLVIGGWVITRSPLQDLTGFLAVAILGVLGLLSNVIVAPWLHADLMSAARMQWSYAIASLIPLAIALGGTGLLIYRYCRASDFCRGNAIWRLQPVFIGTVAGILLLFQQLLSAVLASATVHGIERQSLLYVQWFVTVALVQSVAEELLFRGGIFDYLYKVRSLSLWWSMLITLSLNLLIYLPLIPPDLSAGEVTIFLLQPAMLAVTCSLLWSWDRSISACLACNVTFRLLLMMLW
ncbi:MAG: hypothetical protein R2873_29930 [Caldilineaceae bacterium]|nr:CPBP family intramembrane metalloprotease [Caldilineaceae bacterium]